MAEVDTHQPSKYSKKPQRPAVRLDMTPFVDVALLMLTFFMLTTAFRLPNTLELNLPDDTPVKMPQSRIIRIKINHNNEFYIEAHGEPEIKINSNELPNLLKKYHRPAALIHTQSPVLLVKIHSKAGYGQMIRLVDDLNLAISELNEEYQLQGNLRLTPKFAFTDYDEN